VHAQGYPAGRRAWARAQLVRGSSSGAVWEISADYPEARLTIGADPSAGWPIQAAGVQPVHCELFWDGTALWVADTHGAGGVFLDGQRVAEWVQIQGPAELRFGTAALDIETSPPEHEQMASRPDAARPVTMTDMHLPPEDARRSGPIFGGAASDDSIPELDAAATRVVASPLAPPAAPEPPSDALADLRPRLGGNVVAGSAEATRMVAMPPARPAPAAPQRQTPAPVVAPPPPSPVAPSFDQVEQVAPAFPPPDVPLQPAAAAPPADGGPFVAPPAAPKPPEKASPLAPVLEQLKPLLAKLKPQSSAEVVSASGGKKGQALPTRTWIMLAVTLAAAVGLLLWEEEEPEMTSPAPPAAAVAPQPAGLAAAQPAVPEPEPAAPPTAEAPAPGPEAPPSPAAPDASEAGTVNEAAAEGTEDAKSLQRQAADHYIAGRYPEALVIYRQLAQANPQNEAYASMVQILERRTRCRDGVGPGGEPCGNR